MTQSVRLVNERSPAYAGHMTHWTTGIVIAFFCLSCTPAKTLEPDASLDAGTLVDPSGSEPMLPPTRDSLPIQEVDADTPIPLKKQEDSGTVPNSAMPTKETTDDADPAESCGVKVDALLSDLQEYESLIKSAAKTNGPPTADPQTDILGGAYSSLQKQFRDMDTQTLSNRCREEFLSAEMAFRRLPAPSMKAPPKHESSRQDAALKDEGQVEAQDKLMRRLLCMQACNDRKDAVRRQQCVATCQSH